MDQYYFTPWKRPGESSMGVLIFSQKFYEKEKVISDQGSSVLGYDENDEMIIDPDFAAFADEVGKKFGADESCESSWTVGTMGFDAFAKPSSEDLRNFDNFVAFLDNHPNFKRNLDMLNLQDGEVEYVCTGSTPSTLTLPTTGTGVTPTQPEQEKTEKEETVEEKLARYQREELEMKAQIAKFELERSKILASSDRKFDVSVKLHAENERSQIKTFEVRGTYTDSKGRGKIDIDIHKDVNQDDLNAVLAWANEQLENLDTFTIKGPAYSIDSSFLQSFSIGRFCIDQLHACALDVYINEFQDRRNSIKRPESPCS